MSQEEKSPGTIGWHDLTVADAPQLRDFYSEVSGWTVEECPMGGYSDYVMKDPRTGSAVAGVCHARGPNADLPPQWLLHVRVADLPKCLEACKRRGGTVISHRPSETGGLAVIRDPAGAVMALIQE